jgi:hypothetical protein
MGVVSMGIFVLDFNPQTKTVNGLGLELTRHLILEIGFGKVVSRMDVEGMSSVHRLVREGTDGMIRNATTRHTLYVVMQLQQRQRQQKPQALQLQRSQVIVRIKTIFAEWNLLSCLTSCARLKLSGNNAQKDATAVRNL